MGLYSHIEFKHTFHINKNIFFGIIYSKETNLIDFYFLPDHG
jgi:hypothetical protein